MLLLCFCRWSSEDWSNLIQLGLLIAAIITAYYLYHTLSEQKKSSDFAIWEANFRITYQAINQLVEDINKFEYNNRSGKEAMKLFAHDCEQQIASNNFNSNLLDDIDKLRLPLLGFKRVMLLKEALTTKQEYLQFINRELRHVYVQYFAEVYGIMSTWNFDPKKDSIPRSSLEFIKTELILISKKISLLPKE